MNKGNDEFSGVWRSRYWYSSNDHPDTEETSEYQVIAHQRGNKITMTSTPNQDGSYITVRLTVDDGLATGAWQESTAPLGPFKGMVYSGAMQLIISDDNQRMDGKWVGIGREKLDNGSYEPQIYTGKWELVREAS